MDAFPDHSFVWSFPFNMGMLYLIWRELGMGKFPHSWLSSHSETEFPHSRLRRSWGNTLSLFLLSHSCGNFFSRLRGFATQGGKIPSLILSRWEIAHFRFHKIDLNTDIISFWDTYVKFSFLIPLNALIACVFLLETVSLGWSLLECSASAFSRKLESIFLKKLP